MAQILVRNLDEGVKEGLRGRARAHGRSLEAEVRDILRVAAAEPMPRDEIGPPEGLGSKIVRLVRESGLVFPEFEDVNSTSRPVIDFSGPEYDR